MEGGSPTLIWDRWTLPMYYAQQRYWGDNPRVDQLFRMANFPKFRPRKTKKPSRVDEKPKRPIDWSQLDE